MAIPIAREVADGADLLDPATLDRIVLAWKNWAGEAKDVGVQTSSILRSLTVTSEAAARTASEAHHDRTGQSGGNGALMRTAPVALAYLRDGSGLTEAARRVAQLTHWDEDAGDACVLWCHAIRHAVITGELDIRVGLSELSYENGQLWKSRIAEAEAQQPEDFHSTNGWVVTAFQSAWSAIFHGVAAGESIVGVLECAVRGGGDTDTVAAIAGSLMGAASGVSRIPAAWRRIIHGWPGLNYRDLLGLGIVIGAGKTTRRVLAEAQGWPLAPTMPMTFAGGQAFGHDGQPGTGDANVFVQHPHDDGVWLGSLLALDTLPATIDAVISLCRVGTQQIPQSAPGAGAEVIEFWLIDQAGENLDTAFVLTDAADTVAALRAEGKNVLIQCVAAQNRTPAVGIAYSILQRGVAFEKASTEVRSVLPDPRENR